MFPQAHELRLDGYLYNNRFSTFGNTTALSSTMIPWARINKVSICATEFITATGLGTVLQLASEMRVLEINDDPGVISGMILRDEKQLASRISTKVSFYLLRWHDSTSEVLLEKEALACEGRFCLNLTLILLIRFTHSTWWITQ